LQRDHERGTHLDLGRDGEDEARVTGAIARRRAAAEQGQATRDSQSNTCETNRETALLVREAHDDLLLG
jgi:hypothetical protein